MPYSTPSDHTILKLVLTMNLFPPKSTKSKSKILMPHMPPRADKQCTIHWVDRAKVCNCTMWLLSVEAGCLDAYLTLRILVKILGLKSWKSRHAIMKISTCHHENHNVHNKISPCHQENLDLSSWKSRPVIKKISTLLNKILTCCHENLDCS